MLFKIMIMTRYMPATAAKRPFVIVTHRDCSQLASTCFKLRFGSTLAGLHLHFSLKHVTHIHTFQAVSVNTNVHISAMKAYSSVPLPQQGNLLFLLKDRSSHIVNDMFTDCFLILKMNHLLLR